MPRESGASSTPSPCVDPQPFIPKAGNTGSPAFAGDDGLFFGRLVPRQRPEIDRLVRLILAFDLEEREGAQRLGALARPQRAKRLADLAVLARAVDRDQGAGRMGAERGGECDLLLGGRERLGQAGRTEPGNQLLSQALGRGPALVLIGFDDLRERRPTERRYSEEAGTKCGAHLAGQRGGIRAREHEAARHGPFTRLGGTLEHERVRRIEPDRPQELHVSLIMRRQRRGPPEAGSSHDGLASAGISGRRSTASLVMRRTRRSPLWSISRRTPFSGASRSR